MKKIKSWIKKIVSDPGNINTANTSFYWISLLVLISVPYYFYQGGDHLVWGKENIALVFISFAGIAKGFMDTISDHFGKSIFKKAKYWDKKTSSINKYIDGDPTKGRRKFFKYIPIPVMFTDGWHLFQSFHINLVMLAIVCQYYFTVSHYNFIVDFIVFSFLYRAFFFMFYKYFLIKK